MNFLKKTAFMTIALFFVSSAMAQTSTGCGQNGAKGNISRQITVNGVTRHFDIVVPQNYKKNIASPLVFVFHSFDGSIAEAKSYGIGDAANTAGSDAIFVYPQALVHQPENVPGWELTPNGYDIKFFDQALNTLSNEYCVDSKRVFAAGFSWGADFTNTLGCSRGNKLRAIAPASGSIYEQGTCTEKAPAFRITYDVADPYYTQQEFRNAINLAKTRNDCSNQVIPSTPNECERFRGCENPVIRCGYTGIGHALPPQGGANIWKFFSAF